MLPSLHRLATSIDFTRDDLTDFVNYAVLGFIIDSDHSRLDNDFPEKVPAIGKDPPREIYLVQMKPGGDGDAVMGTALVSFRNSGFEVVEHGDRLGKVILEYNLSYETNWRKAAEDVFHELKWAPLKVDTETYGKHSSPAVYVAMRGQVEGEECPPLASLHPPPLVPPPPPPPPPPPTTRNGGKAPAGMEAVLNELLKKAGENMNLRETSETSDLTEKNEKQLLALAIQERATEMLNNPNKSLGRHWAMSRFKPSGNRLERAEVLKEALRTRAVGSEMPLFFELGDEEYETLVEELSKPPPQTIKGYHYIELLVEYEDDPRRIYYYKPLSGKAFESAKRDARTRTDDTLFNRIKQAGEGKQSTKVVNVE
tara:strand:+ start:568 stop:1674 length:1107 start_codon:yes stop_codon:yes gene_type:complete